MVNGSSVTLTGAIDVSENEFGGIESSKGSGVTKDPSLTVTGVNFTNTTEAYGLPTIWEDGVTGTVTTSDGQFTQITKGTQPQYYLDAENSVDPIAAALAAVNDYFTSEKYVYESAPAALEDHLATLGMDVSADSAYKALDERATGGTERLTAVMFDLMHNKPEDGYDQATLTTYFNEIVGTRGLTQASMNMVLAAKEAGSIESLKELEFVNILLNRFKDETLSYTKHSNKPFSDKVAELQPIVDTYNALTSDQQDAALTELLGKVVNRSQDTIDEFAAILYAIEGVIQATPDTIQAALDNASDGTMFILNPGEYGTIYLRQSESRSRSVDVSNWAGDGDVERYREFKDISIVGTTGAKVDQIDVEAQDYIPGSGHSNDNGVNYLKSYISISNLTIKNIEFTGDKPVAVNFQSIWGHSGVNGLTIDGCTLTGKDEYKTATSPSSFLLRADGEISKDIKDNKGSGELIMTTGRSNLTVKNCTVNNVWMPINITEWHGIDIRDNNFSNTGRNDIMITGPSVGDVNIIGNTLSNAAERSIRLNTITGKISITDNTIENCAGREITTDGTTEKSLMKISSSGDGTTVELSGNSWNGLNDAAAVEDNDQNILLESEGIAFTVK